MTDSELDAIYKTTLGVSHFAGLRAVFDAGYNLGTAMVPTTITPDETTVVTDTTAATYVDPTSDITTS
jgi:hypothetical protein